MTTEQQPQPIGEITEITEVTEVTEVTEGAPPVPPAPPAPPVKKDRRVLRAVLRWTAAVVVFAAAGAGTAYGITRMERTDVPGLASESDGRWEYPAIVKPPLPSGSPAPFDKANAANSHYADLRELLLPAPKGAKADQALEGKAGWLAKKDFLAVYEDKDDRDAIDQLLTDQGLRHVAARGWTAADGTHTRIYLLQFETARVVDSLQENTFTGYDAPQYALKGASEVHIDEKFPEKAEVENVRHYVYGEAEPYGAEHVREAYLVSGDVLGLVVQSKKGGAAAVPFQQTVVLQSQLLG
ncbi:hypothetical protein SAMN06272735_3942 [Streptomyces sp. TLI_55]|uniref:hypothetical protein n=1 Tax=Streptomyces sp. TLI_55 TaxID=1938861 RepID=UPI000BC65C59|nr:hypothetical protein [Streptomyces sp. TLI_55]SNX62186.1 hypothetical protein SAMN06272735_3942 [Streptomyces sp. TLI_55]